MIFVIVSFMKSQITLFHQGGTLVLAASEGAREEIDEHASIPPPFRFIRGRWRCEGYRYREVVPWLRSQKIRDTIPRWQTSMHWTLQDGRVLHEYQIAALDAWQKAGSRGSVVLPTGSGKTVVAINAIARAGCSTLVVVPTIPLLHQWYYRLTHALRTEIGVYYNAEKILQPITVVTYQSAADLLCERDQNLHYKYIIFDEIHHLASPTWSEIAVMAVAPMRLGLTATYPEPHENGRSRLDDLVGPLVYTQRIEDLVGLQLAEYRTSRVRVSLTERERKKYNENYEIYTSFVRQERLRERKGKGWLQELTHLSAHHPGARRAFLARQRNLRLLAGAEGKIRKLDELLLEYAAVGEQILIFTEDTRTAYRISLRYFVPAVTYQTSAAERKEILDFFDRGDYRIVVASQVLDEGVDVPAAKIALILGGSGSARQQKQRLGRILRKVENRQAELIEVIVRGTIEEGKSQRRRIRD